ncbi:MAG: ABC transporter substrate-binding protein [Treponema sp.]|nr:ABC transporter substrate-binding protein [Treponema sp.]
MKQKKAALLCAALVLALMASCKPAESGELTMKKGVLMIGMEIGYPPMEYFDASGTPIGFDVEMGKAIADKLGLDPEFIDTAWEGIFSGVDTKKYDCIMSSVTINPARQAVHNFSKPYVSNTLAMVVLKGTTVTARTPIECTGLDVAFQSDTTSDFYMEKLAAGGLKYTPRRYEKVMYCFDELKLKRVDVIVTDLLVAIDYIADPNGPFEIVWKSTEDERFGICLKKGNDALTNAINNALDELFEEGTMLKISNDTFGMDLVSAARQ